MMTMLYDSTGKNAEIFFGAFIVHQLCTVTLRCVICTRKMQCYMGSVLVNDENMGL